MTKCPKCKKDVGEFFYCTSCGTLLKEECPSCGKWVDTSTKNCPKCGRANRIYVAKSS